MRDVAISPGTPVLLYLHSPREKVFGVLLSLESAGVAVRGLDLVSFEDWMRQEARGDRSGLALVSIFYPMGRVERMERDETLGDIEGLADRYARVAGRSFVEAAGVSIPRTRR